jgi:hypothetical protein
MIYGFLRFFVFRKEVLRKSGAKGLRNNGGRCGRVLPFPHLHVAAYRVI